MALPAILSAGIYTPGYRLQRSEVGEALGTGGGKGSRTVASFDEDTTTMAVAAAQRCLRLPAIGVPPQNLLFSTAHPTYVEKNVASTIHAALDLPMATAAFDMVGSYRAAAGSLLAGLRAGVPTLVVHADMRAGLPGSSEEREGGSGAVAMLTGPVSGGGDALATLLGYGSATSEFLDRWRLPGQPSPNTVEDRLGEHVYAPLVAAATRSALAEAGVATEDVNYLAVAGTNLRAVRATQRWADLREARAVEDGFDGIGNLGAAQGGMVLARALAGAEPDEIIALVALADGVDALIFRVGSCSHREALRKQLAAVDRPGQDISYVRYLTWRGLLAREGPHRPDPDPPAPAPALRNSRWKFALVASRCTKCGVRHMPPQRVCLNCGIVDEMEDDPLADDCGTATVVTVDNLAMTQNPPLSTALIEFDGGGRHRFEITDAEPDEVQIGGRLEMSFRKLYTSEGTHDYFWKARPVCVESRHDTPSLPPEEGR